ncbi:MAG: anti-anti-sigma regulatory factor [Pirellulaceae bacterium]|jgi:anti-anti-sigma regulatory factor
MTKFANGQVWNLSRNPILVMFWFGDVDRKTGFENLLRRKEMDQQLAPGWTAELECGPDWLFVRLYWSPVESGESPDLAEPIWQLLHSNMLNRLVLETENVPLLSSHLIGELVRLHKRVAEQGGMVRLSGTSDENQDIIRTARLAERFPHFRNREDAVMGYRPRKPR